MWIFLIYAVRRFSEVDESGNELEVEVEGVELYLLA